MDERLGTDDGQNLKDRRKPAVKHDQPRTVGSSTSSKSIWRTERGLAPRSIIRPLPTIRLFLHEVCPGGADDLKKIGQQDVIATSSVTREIGDQDRQGDVVTCWPLRAFHRYLYHRRLNSRDSAGCAPSIRRWKLETLPTYLPTARVRKVLDGCDRATAMGMQDYAILICSMGSVCALTR